MQDGNEKELVGKLECAPLEGHILPILKRNESNEVIGWTH